MYAATLAVKPRDAAGPRILFYSHDTFGLGHLRRSRAIATAFAGQMQNVSALILTGSPVAGRFSFPAGVDHVRLPGVVKLPNGEYDSENLRLSIDQTTALRASIIEATVESFDPDLIIVDKEPTGFRGELLGVLTQLERRAGASGERGGARPKVVLGVRDVLDEPDALIPEWERKGAREALERYYDEIWVYGLPQVYRPLEALDLTTDARRRIRYTGYLRREALSDSIDSSIEQPYVLITPGGGGDGALMVDWAISAYEKDPSLKPHAVVVYGPFLAGEQRIEFDQRIAALGDRVTALGFASNMEALMHNAVGVVGMGGYNTFCEILSFDKPSVLCPRVRPRREQHIRASAAEELGLLRMLDPVRDGSGAAAMGTAIRALADQPPPSAAGLEGLLDGLLMVSQRAAALLEDQPMMQASPV
ncbi:MAG: hypothetical protein MRY74_16635 [Neomegalonema sp.]|nr:hypothetical protein [Neomegalonema sp.]